MYRTEVIIEAIFSISYEMLFNVIANRHHITLPSFFSLAVISHIGSAKRAKIGHFLASAHIKFWQKGQCEQPV